MGYLPQRSIATTAKSTSVPTGRKRREDLRAGTTFGQNGTQKCRLNLIYVKSAKKPRFLYCFRHQRVIHPGVNTVQHRMRVFTISQKTKPNSKKGYCLLCTGHRCRNSEQKDSFLFLLQSNVRHLLFNEQIIPYYKEKRMEEM